MMLFRKRCTITRCWGNRTSRHCNACREPAKPLTHRFPPGFVPEVGGVPGAKAAPAVIVNSNTYITTTQLEVALRKLHAADAAWWVDDQLLCISCRSYARSGAAAKPYECDHTGECLVAPVLTELEARP